ncbi:MAG: hypothetical protein WC707_00655 [Candidatus Babeliaceae bacterium]
MKRLMRLLLVTACVFFTLDIVSSIGPSKLFRRGERALQQVPSQPAFCPPQVPGLSTTERMAFSPAFQLSLQQRLAGLKTQNFQPIMPIAPSFASQARAFDMMKCGGASTFQQSPTLTNFFKMAKTAAPQKRGYATYPMNIPVDIKEPMLVYETYPAIKAQAAKIEVPEFLKTGDKASVPLKYVAQYINSGSNLYQYIDKLLRRPYGFTGHDKYTLAMYNRAYDEHIALSVLATYIIGDLEVDSPFSYSANTYNEGGWRIKISLKNIVVPDFTQVIHELYHMKFPITKKTGWFRTSTENISLADMGADELLSSAVILNGIVKKRVELIEELVALKRSTITDPVELQNLTECNHIINSILSQARSRETWLKQDSMERNTAIDPQIYEALESHIASRNFENPVDNSYFDRLTSSKFTSTEEEKIKGYVEKIEGVARKWRNEIKKVYPEGESERRIYREISEHDESGALNPAEYDYSEDVKYFL